MDNRKTDREVYSANTDIPCTHTHTHTHAAHVPHTYHVFSFPSCSYAEPDDVSLLCILGRTTCLFGGGFEVSFLSYLPHILTDVRKRKEKRGKPYLMLRLKSGWLPGLSWGTSRKMP